MKLKLHHIFITLCLLAFFAAPVFARGGGGCFLEDTPITMADGSTRPIQSLHVGDQLLSFDSENHLLPATLERIYAIEADDYLEVATPTATLRVTPEHPFRTIAGEFLRIGSWHPGDLLTLRMPGGFLRLPILSITPIHAHAIVYNLQTSEPHTYFAADIEVHNKGGGCFPAGTMIRTPSGVRPIESIKDGDELLGVDSSRSLVLVHVRECFTRTSELTILDTDHGVLRTTDEHPLLLPSGGFAEAADLKLGDRVMVAAGISALPADRQPLSLIPARITAIHHLTDPTQVYNLGVDGPHTYLADGFVVHNKGGGGGGCFPAGTPISTLHAAVPIESIKPGDLVVSLDENGRPSTSRVNETFVQKSPTLILHTDQGDLVTTDEHPLQLWAGGFLEASQLHVGREIVAWKNQRAEPAIVQSFDRSSEPVLVYNLSVESPHTYVAGGFVVHNKGGGGGGGGHSFSGGGGWGYHGGGGYSSSTQPGGSDSLTYGQIAMILLIIVLPMAITYGLMLRGIIAGQRELPSGFRPKVTTRSFMSRDGEELDLLLARPRIDPRARLVAGLIGRAAGADPSFDPTVLDAVARSTFLKLQECWQARDYRPMRQLLMPELQAQHEGLIRSMVKANEINMVDVHGIKDIDIIHFRYGAAPDDREFTALITATAVDYFVNANTKAFIRGDRVPQTFQEFWTFHLVGRSWLLRDIEQTKESDILRETPDLSGLASDPVEETPPPLPEEHMSSDKIAQLMDFLGKNDPLWRRQTVGSTARNIYTNVYMARESGSTLELKTSELTLNFADKLRSEISEREKSGTKIEYRNFCVRKIQIVTATPPGSAGKPPQITARVTAHALIIESKDNHVIRQDPYIKSFVECCVFVRDKNAWKLDEVLPTFGFSEDIFTSET